MKEAVGERRKEQSRKQVQVLPIPPFTTGCNGQRQKPRKKNKRDGEKKVMNPRMPQLDSADHSDAWIGNEGGIETNFNHKGTNPNNAKQNKIKNRKTRYSQNPLRVGVSDPRGTGGL